MDPFLRDPPIYYTRSKYHLHQHRLYQLDKRLGITLRPRAAYSAWTNGKVETQNQHIASYWRHFLNDVGNTWSSLAPHFAFAHNTSVNYTTGKTPYGLVFGTKPQIPMSLNLASTGLNINYVARSSAKLTFICILQQTQIRTSP